MSLTAYFIVDDAQTPYLQILNNKVVLTSCTTAVDFENCFKDTSPLIRVTLMMWIAAADGNDIFFVCNPEQYVASSHNPYPNPSPKFGVCRLSLTPFISICHL